MQILLADLYRAIVEWVQTVLTGGDGDDHLGSDDLPIDASGALGRDSENFAHSDLIFKRVLIIDVLFTSAKLAPTCDDFGHKHKKSADCYATLCSLMVLRKP